MSKVTWQGDLTLLFPSLLASQYNAILFDTPLHMLVLPYINTELQQGFHTSTVLRVWKGILGIRDSTKIRCGIRENAKYLDGIRDLTALWEAGFAKIWARGTGFFGLSVGNS